MWKPFNTFGDLKGRVRGVSLHCPNSQVLIWTDQGLFSLWFFQSAFLNQLAPADEARKAFDAKTGVLTWNGTAHPMCGECAPGNNSRALTRHPGGDRVTLDPEEDSAHVLDAAGEIQQTIDGVRSATGPWAVATFTADGKALILADSVNVRVFKYEASKGHERPRWAAVAGTADQNQLFRAVLDNPDEDTPRLMYADWLEEHDDPARAEFIRLQCRLAERYRRESVPTHHPDLQREFQLQNQLGDRWLAEMPSTRGVKWANFWRGFPAVSVVSVSTLVSARTKLWAASPVEWATVVGLNTNGVRALTGSDVLARLRVLTLDHYYTRHEGEKTLRTLFASPRLKTLRRLNLTQGINEAGLIVIAESEHLTGLEWLSVTSGEMTDAAAESLMTSPALKNLRGGSFSSHRLSERVRERLKTRFPHSSV